MRVRVKAGASFSETLNRGSINKRRYPWDKDVIDWSAPIDDQHVYMPAEYTFLAGTPLANKLSLEAKSFVTRWEFTQLMRNNSIGEHMLNQALLSILYHTDFYDPSYRYMLHEVAEECQHMGMFNEWVRLNRDIRTKGAGQEKWGLAASMLTPVLATRFPPLFWVLAILFEVFGDHIARSAVREPNPLLHPIALQMHRAHMIEETRHVAFAKEWLSNAYPRMSKTERMLLRRLTETILFRIAKIGILMPYSRQIAPFVSLAEFKSAMHSPYRKERVRQATHGTAVFLAETGVVGAEAVWALAQSRHSVH